MIITKNPLRILIIILVNFYSLISQPSQSNQQEFYYDKPFLLVTLVSGIVEDENSIEKEVLSIITNSARDLGSFNIIDFDSVAYLFKEYTPETGKILDDSTLVIIGQLAYAHEMMVVEIKRYWQQAQNALKDEKRTKDDNEIIISDSSRESQQTVSRQDSLIRVNYIQTHLSVQIRIFDMESGQIFESFNLEVNQTRRSYGESRAAVIKKLQEKTAIEMKKIYLLSPTILESKKMKVILGMGSRVGIEKGMIFSIRQADQIEDYFGEIISIPGKEIGIVSADEILEERSVATIQRQNEFIQPGYHAFEFTRSIYGLRIAFSPAFVDSMMSLGAQFYWHAIQKWSYGLGFRLIRVNDSYGDHDYGFGMEGLGGVHISSLPKLRLMMVAGINFDIPFRKDDDGNVVYLPILSGQMGVMFDIVHYWKTDISISAGYRISSKIRNWQISDEEETGNPIYWENNPPRVNISGFYIEIGYKILFLSDSN
jgi:hypothetical protein